MENLIYTKAVIEKGTDDTMRIIASTEAIDRDGEVIKLSGWDLKAFKSNPVLLWAHNNRDLPLGKFLSITKSKIKGTLEGTIKWASEEANPFVAQVKAQFEEGIMNSFSVGFIPRERDVNDPNIITKAELLEVSVVPVPANPEAMALLSAKGFSDKKDVFTFDPKEMKEFVKDNKYNPTQLADFILQKMNKTAITFKSYKLLDKGANWDIKNVDANLKAWATVVDLDKDIINFSIYKEAFAWFNADKPQELGSYKFAHHDYQDEVVTNWKGVTIAMADLLGEKGTDIPESERKAVYDHLAKHYKEFGEEAPKFGEGKDVRVTLTKEYKQTIKDTISTLQDLLDGSEKALENGDSMDDLSDSDKEDLKTNLKVAKLFAEAVMRQLNSK